MDEDLLSFRVLRIDEGHELIDLVEGRRCEIVDADLLVLKPRVFDLERIEPVALEAHDDGVAHLPETGEIPFHVRGPRQACKSAAVDRVVEHLHAESPSPRSSSK